MTTTGWILIGVGGIGAYYFLAPRLGSRIAPFGNDASVPSVGGVQTVNAAPNYSGTNAVTTGAGIAPYTAPFPGATITPEGSQTVVPGARTIIPSQIISVVVPVGPATPGGRVPIVSSPSRGIGTTVIGVAPHGNVSTGKTAPQPQRSAPQVATKDKREIGKTISRIN